MSAKWCPGSPTNEYAGQGGHWYDPAGIAAPKPVPNCVCPADVEVGWHQAAPAVETTREAYEQLSNVEVGSHDAV